MSTQENEYGTCPIHGLPLHPFADSRGESPDVLVCDGLVAGINDPLYCVKRTA